MSSTDLAGMKVPAGGGEKLSFFGMDLLWKVTPEMSNDTFLQIEHVSPPETGVPVHIHQNEDESLYVIEGELVAQLGDETLAVRAGDSVMMPKGIPHGWRVTGDKTARILFTFESSPASDLQTMFTRLVGLTPADFDQVLTICGETNIEFLMPPTMP